MLAFYTVLKCAKTHFRLKDESNFNLCLKDLKLFIMGWKIVNITEAKSLSFYLGNLLVKKENHKFFIPLNDIDVLLIATFQAVVTTRLLVELARKNILVIQCDEKYVPILQLTPLEGNYRTAEVFRTQLAWDEAQKGLLWKSLIEQKIRNQSLVLKNANSERQQELEVFRTQVKVHDLTNREGHAAKVYFNGLFSDNFNRDNENDPRNVMLNYGYAILRAYFCRSIIAKGLDPRIAIFHHNIFNYFALASDLMEPLRPFVDYFVYNSFETELNSEFKRKLLNQFNEKILVDNQKMYMTDAILYIVEELYRNQRIAEIYCHVSV